LKAIERLRVPIAAPSEMKTARKHSKTTAVTEEVSSSIAENANGIPKNGTHLTLSAEK